MLRISLVALFVYLTVTDGIANGDIVYAVLFTLLAIDYLVELVSSNRR